MKAIKTLLFLLAMAFSLHASAGQVKMKTAKAAGETMAIALNAGIPVTLTWGDGSSEELFTTGQLQEITVKAANLTLSSDKDITALYLAECGLTVLDVTGVAGTLRRLFCPDNQLETLNVSGCTNLVSFDCQGNKLRSLSVLSPNIEDLNIADNQLTTNGLRSAENVTSLVCANNKITVLSYLSSMSNLKTLFFQNNSVSTAGVSKNVALVDVLGFNNKLTAFNAKPLVALENVWLGNNKLPSLDFSDDVVLATLCAENNLLTEVLTNRTIQKTLKAVDLSDNELLFNSLPTIYNSTSATYTLDGSVSPQRPTQIFNDMNVDERSESLVNLIGRNAWSAPTSAKVTIVDGSGKELVADTDYKYGSYRLTFLTAPHEGVVVNFTSANYPDLVLSSKPFNVSDPNGIVLLETESLENSPVYDLSGRQIANGKTANGQLPKGIYIIGGKKVVVK